MTDKNVGSFARNFHSGARSETLAQFVFSDFGAAVPVPRPEDGGFDLYATLTDERGQLSWPRFHYTVQVKSEFAPWEFGTRDSVDWLLRHPFPILLCVVEKKAKRIRVYHTFPRYLLWVSGQIPDKLVLTPADATEGRATEWVNGTEFSLGAPIIDRALSELMDPAVSQATKAVLSAWLEMDWQNAKRVSIGLPWYETPGRYATNDSAILAGGWAHQWNTAPERFAPLEPIARQLIAWVADFCLNQQDIHASALAAMLFHGLWPNRQSGAPEPHFAFQRLNILLKLFSTEKLFAAVDDLSLTLDERIKWLQANGPDMEALGQ